MSVTSSTLKPIFPSLRPRPKCNVPLQRCHAVTFGAGWNDWQRVEGPQLIELSATAHLHIVCIGEFLSPELGSDVTERNASHLFHSLRWGRNRIIHADPANINYRRNRIGMRYEPKPLSWFISIFYVTFNRFNSSPKVLANIGCSDIEPISARCIAMYARHLKSCRMRFTSARIAWSMVWGLKSDMQCWPFVFKANGQTKVQKDIESHQKRLGGRFFVVGLRWWISASL